MRISIAFVAFRLYRKGGQKLTQFANECSYIILQNKKNDKIYKARLYKILSRDKKQISIIAVIALLFLVGLYSLTPETRRVVVSIPYQDPVYDTRRVAVSVPYQEAVYETFYCGTLKDTGLSTLT